MYRADRKTTPKHFAVTLILAEYAPALISVPLTLFSSFYRSLMVVATVFALYVRRIWRTAFAARNDYYTHVTRVRHL